MAKKKRKLGTSLGELLRRQRQSSSSRGIRTLIDEDGSSIKSTPVKVNGVQGYKLES